LCQSSQDSRVIKVPKKGNAEAVTYANYK
jgi:hypothetical protein